MGIVEILAILAGATKLADIIVPIVERMTNEGREDLTPAEVARVKAQQKTAEEDWSTVLARLRAGDS